MKRKLVITIRPKAVSFCLAVAACLMGQPDPVLAQDADRFAGHQNAASHEQAYLMTIELLDSEGYIITSVGRSWMNRIIIRAIKEDIRREIVISQSTGMVLRDIVFGFDGAP